MRNPKSDIIIVVLFIHYSAHLILSKHDVIIAMSKKSRNPFSYRSESLYENGTSWTHRTSPYKRDNCIDSSLKNQLKKRTKTFLEKLLLTRIIYTSSNQFQLYLHLTQNRIRTMVIQVQRWTINEFCACRPCFSKSKPDISTGSDVNNKCL